MKYLSIALITVIVVSLALLLYNIVPLLIYFIKRYLWPKSKKGTQLDPKSPSSPWVRARRRPPAQRLVDQCSTVVELFSKTAEKFRNRNSFGCRRTIREENEEQADGKVFKKLILGDYQWYTFGQIDQRVELISKGFLHIGIKPHDRVMIFSETRFEWMLSCQALFRIGATVATLYATLGEDGIIYGINETKVKHLIINYDLLDKLKNILDQLKGLETVVYLDGFKETNLTELFSEEHRKKIHFYSFKEIEQTGQSHNDLQGKAPEPEDIAVIMYTSGSTGIPKGVMISHTNLLAAVQSFCTLAEHLTEKDTYIAFLPLAHILEMSAELFFISCGLTVGFATIQTLTDNSSAIKGGNKGDAPMLRPTMMTAVPLVLDRIKKAITDKISKSGIVTKILFKVFFHSKLFWMKKGFDTPLINMLFCSQFRAVLGGRLRFIAVGGAPLSPEIHDFVRACFNVAVIQGYGLTETSASATIMSIEDMSVGFVGPPLEGIRIKLIDWEEGNCKTTDKPHPRGEVVIGGKNVSKGYFNNEELTKESFKEEDGIKWFNTGDIGEISKDGSLKIIDRKKDIIKLSTGEYVSLAKIEEELKKNEFVENVCVYGHPDKDFLIALVSPNKKQLQSLAQSLSKDNSDLKRLCEDKDMKDKILESFQKSLKQSKLLKWEIPKDITLCSEEWTTENGLVTAALKLRRKNLQEFYQKDINRMYGTSVIS